MSLRRTDPPTCLGAHFVNSVPHAAVIKTAIVRSQGTDLVPTWRTFGFVRQLGSSTTLRCSVCTEGHPQGGVVPCTVMVSVLSWNPAAVSRSS